MSLPGCGADEYKEVCAVYRLFASLLVVAALTSGAQGDVTWTGAVDNDWFNTGNWEGGALPTADDKALIGTTSPAPLLDAPGAITDDTEVGNGGVGELQVSAGGEIEVVFGVGAEDNEAAAVEFDQVA